MSGLLAPCHGTQGTECQDRPCRGPRNGKATLSARLGSSAPSVVDRGYDTDYTTWATKGEGTGGFSESASGTSTTENDTCSSASSLNLSEFDLGTPSIDREDNTLLGLGAQFQVSPETQLIISSNSKQKRGLRLPPYPQHIVHHSDSGRPNASSTARPKKQEMVYDLVSPPEPPLDVHGSTPAERSIETHTIAVSRDPLSDGQQNSGDTPHADSLSSSPPLSIHATLGSKELSSTPSAVPMNARTSTTTSVSIATDRSRGQAQLSPCRVLEAFAEYSSYLEHLAEQEERDSTDEEPEDTERNQQESTPTTDTSDAIRSETPCGSSRHGGAQSAQLPRRTDERRRLTQDEGNHDSEDEDRHEKRQRPPPDYRHDEQLAELIVCPEETCCGRDNGYISQWAVKLHHHGWYVCCVCLCRRFSSKEDLDAHKASRECFKHCVIRSCPNNLSTAETVRHKRTHTCDTRGPHVRRATYEFVCHLLGKEAKPFVHGEEHVHEGMKKRKRMTREQGQNLRENFEREMTKLRLECATLEAERKLAKRDRRANYSVIRRLADEVHAWSAIKKTTLEDLAELPDLFKEEQLAAFSQPVVPFCANCLNPLDTIPGGNDWTAPLPQDAFMSGLEMNGSASGLAHGMGVSGQDMSTSTTSGLGAAGGVPNGVAAVSAPQPQQQQQGGEPQLIEDFNS